MIVRVRNKLKFYLERLILRGAHYRLLVIAAFIGFVSAVAGILVVAASKDINSASEGIWWAFLRITDPGYLGDDKGILVGALSTLVTIVGVVLFMGSLIAIMTQWLSETIRTLESGLTPIAQENHILVLGWSNRTPTIVRELVLSEGRVRRLLRRRGARKLRIVILSEEVSTERRYELRDYLGPYWDENQIIFRSGTPLRIEHLQRVDLMHAAAIILPGSEIEFGGSDAADMRTIKTLLSISKSGRADGNAELPLLVAEIFDARKIPVAKMAYDGHIEILGSDSVISLLVVQNVRHRWLSHVYSELLSHAEAGNEIYIRKCPEFAGVRLQDLVDGFTRAIILGVVRPEGNGYRPILNPPDGFMVQSDDRLVFLARRYRDTEPPSGYTPQPTNRGVQPEDMDVKLKRRILLMGWNDKIPALINEFDNYENETFEIDILSSIPIEKRDLRMARYDLHLKRVKIGHLEGDYAAPSDLVRVQPADYNNVVIVGCDWLKSTEEADARTILGHLLLSQILAGKKEKPDVLLELLDPENHALFEDEIDEVLISPMILSHILAHVALRPDLNAVFHELFSSGGAEIFFRSAEYYDLVGKEGNFRDLQDAVSFRGEIALGVRVDAEAAARDSGIHLNPGRKESWTFTAEDEVIVLTTYA